MLKITLPRGDRTSKKIAIREQGSSELTDIVFDDIYFTVKRVYLAEEFKFQKRMSAGEIVKGEDGYYRFTILPEDTDGLPFGEYDFDIEVVKDGRIKHTTVGTLTLTKEVTYAVNEG
jgi:hypothetical protein